MDLNLNIIPEKTAIKNGISNSCKMIVNDFEDRKKSISILDYGCGKLRNTKYLIKNGFNVSIVDTEKQIRSQLNKIKSLCLNYYSNIDNINLNQKYDVILFSFVLNVIPNIKERDNSLNNIYNLLNNEGLAYIEVRNRNFLKGLKYKVPYNDGVLTGNSKNKTFQKAYTMEEFTAYLSNNNFEICSTKKTSSSLIAIVKRKDN